MGLFLQREKIHCCCIYTMSLSFCYVVFIFSCSFSSPSRKSSYVHPVSLPEWIPNLSSKRVTHPGTLTSEKRKLIRNRFHLKLLRFIFCVCVCVCVCVHESFDECNIVLTVEHVATNSCFIGRLILYL